MDKATPDTVNFLGLQWDRLSDTLHTKKISLNASASTKRQVLKSIAAQYDLYNINGPIFNRSRVFLHGLQCNKSLGWDDTLSDDLF